MKTNACLTLVLLATLSTIDSQLSTLHAQGTIVTYQGRVTDNGTNFTGAGLFKFALVTSTNANSQATATANPPSGGFVTVINVTFGGSGYVSAPAVIITGGGGSGCTATAQIGGGAVTSITVNNPGSGYTSTPAVTVAPPPQNLSLTTFWSNDGTSTNGSEPLAPVLVSVNNGLFTVALGDTTLPDMTVIPVSLFVTPNLQLRIWFNDGVNGSAALSPVQNLTTTPYAVVASSINGGFSVRNNTSGAPDVIGGASDNFVSSGVVGATIGGGGATSYLGSFAYTNSVTDNFGTISGGSANTAGFDATVGGGGYNTAAGDDSTVGGGNENTASAVYSAVGGGFDNTASGYGATIPGGGFNVADHYFSFAAGNNAHAVNNYSFVWSDGYGGTAFSSTADAQFAVEAHGGVLLAADVQLSPDTYHNLSLTGGNAIGYLYGSYPALGDGIHLGYNWYYDAAGTGHVSNSGGATSRLSLQYGQIVLAIGGVGMAPSTNRLVANASGVTVYGTFNNSSDRNAKQDFASISPAQILDKVTRLPLSEWSYKEDAATRHLGPVAQDFYSIFNLGTDDKHIAPMDEGGVALAAIQGLNQELKEKDVEIADLKVRLERLEQLITSTKENRQRNTASQESSVR